MYAPGQIIQMSLAVELTQLGLPPERLVHVLAHNQFATHMAILMACRALSTAPGGYDRHQESPNNPGSMFIFFDPAALSDLMFDDPALSPEYDFSDETYFYGGADTLGVEIAGWTSGFRSRLSMINVTSMIDMTASALCRLVTHDAGNLSAKSDFFSRVRSFSEEHISRIYDPEAEVFAFKLLRRAIPETLSMTPELIHEIEKRTGLKDSTIRSVLSALIKERKDASGFNS